MKTKEIADLLSGDLSGDGDVEIAAVAALATARSGDIAFVDKADVDPASDASALIAPLDFQTATAKPVIRTNDPKLAFAKLATVLHPKPHLSPGIHPISLIADTAVIADNVYVGPFVSVGDGSEIGPGTQLLAGTCIGERVKIGANCILHPNVTIENDCTLGNSVILHAGVVIGADGFGYVRDSDRYVKFPQIGTVIIGDDVEIGANTCIDRGALGETRIGKGTKIDNLVQIAHNVQIGERVVIAAQTGISGSTVIEDDCVIGGQVGMGDHARVLKGAVIGSQAGVLPGKIVRAGVWWGTPVQPLDEYKRQNARVKGLQRLKTEFTELKTKVDELVKRLK
jgi:UDP-3-O-[3-hydroxymyristoyl] glucosamine N-acyltransferase